jgi:hypothetical protein
MSFEGLLPVYGPWLIFAVVGLESAGIPLPGETTLIAAAVPAGTAHELSIGVRRAGRWRALGGRVTNARLPGAGDAGLT